MENGDGPRITKPGDAIGGRYRIQALLGSGGMGEVWHGQHLVTGRAVAIKLLRRALARRPEMRRRFLREARAAAGISHPNLVEVLDAFETEDGTPAIVMPLLEGRTLARVIASEVPLGVTETLALLTPVISAIRAMHSHGIVHRDLKPDNVFLASEAGRTVVKVLDFGVAKFAADHLDDGTPTGVGTLVGTPAYMAPEQASCEVDQDHRVDIWAIGAIAYELLSGCRPVPGGNAEQVMKRLLTQTITPLHVRVPGVSNALEQTVMQMLQRRPTDRPSLDEVLTRLRPLLASPVDGLPPEAHLSPAWALPGTSAGPAWSELPAVYSTVRPSPDRSSSLAARLPKSRSALLQGMAILGVVLVLALGVAGVAAQLRETPHSVGATGVVVDTASRQLTPASVEALVLPSRTAQPAPSETVGTPRSSAVAAAGSPAAVVRQTRVRQVPRAISEPILGEGKRPRSLDKANPFVSAQ